MWGSRNQQTITAKVGVYVRVSTTEQADKGYGLDTQERKCKGMAMIKDWEVVKIYRHPGISGTLDENKRPGLAELIDDAKKGNINIIIVNSLDRIGRSTRLVLRLVGLFDTLAVSLVSCKESLDTSTPSGKFTLTIFAALGQLERDTIVDRTTAGREERARIDGDKGGRLPLGYARTDRGLIVIDKEAEIVRTIFRLRNKGYTYKGNADYLNSRGLKPRRGKAWYASMTRKITMSSDKYTGGFRGKSQVRWPKIV